MKIFNVNKLNGKVKNWATLNNKITDLENNYPIHDLDCTCTNCSAYWDNLTALRKKLSKMKQPQLIKLN